MQLLRKSLLFLIIFSLIIPLSFSSTCYRSESYCANYGTKNVNCRTESYSYSCTKYGSYQDYVQKTCYNNECSTKTKCDWKTKTVCDTRKVYNICYGNCMNIRYKNCFYSSNRFPYIHYGQHYSCGTETYVYSCSYNCNPYTEQYNCRNENYQDCYNYQDCKNVAYDCSYYETKNGYYQGTCHNTKTVCDKTTDYDNCLNWQEKQVSYDCSEMKLNNYLLSTNSATLNEKITLAFTIKNCEGNTNYELYTKNNYIQGKANCELNIIEFTANTAGTQTILLKLNDERTSITKTIGTLLITNPKTNFESTNPINPANEEFTNQIESGDYDSKINELLNLGLSNEEILKNLMLTFGTIGLALTATQTNKIKNYLDKKINERDNKLINLIKQITINKLNSYQEDYFTKKYLYELEQAQNLQKLNSHSTYYETVQQITLQEVNEAKINYENYLNSLLNDNMMQMIGANEIKNAEQENIINQAKLTQQLNNRSTYYEIPNLNVRNDDFDALISTFTDNGAQTMKGILMSGGIAYTIAATGILMNPAGMAVSAGIGIISIIMTIEEIEKKKKYANLMAYLHGTNSEEYKNAKNGQIVFNIQLALNTIAAMIGGYYGNKFYIKGLKKQLGWNNKDYDYNKHVEKKLEWGEKKISKEQYNLLKDKTINEGKLFEFNYDGEKRMGFYLEKDNYFVSIDKNTHIIKTFFRPREGLNYITSLDNFKWINVPSEIYFGTIGGINNIIGE